MSFYSHSIAWFCFLFLPFPPLAVMSISYLKQKNSRSPFCRYRLQCFLPPLLWVTGKGTLWESGVKNELYWGVYLCGQHELCSVMFDFLSLTQSHSVFSPFLVIIFSLWNMVISGIFAAFPSSDTSLVCLSSCLYTTEWISQVSLQLLLNKLCSCVPSVVKMTLVALVWNTFWL